MATVFSLKEAPLQLKPPPPFLSLNNDKVQWSVLVVNISLHVQRDTYKTSYEKRIPKKGGTLKGILDPPNSVVWGNWGPNATSHMSWSDKLLRYILLSLWHVYFEIQCIEGKNRSPLTLVLAPGASIRENTVFMVLWNRVYWYIRPPGTGPW